MMEEEEYGFSLRFSACAMQGSPLAISSASIHTFSKTPTSLVRMLPCLWGSVQCVTQLYTSNFLPWLNFRPLCPLAPFFLTTEGCQLAAGLVAMTLFIATSPTIHKNDIVRFLGLKYQKSREKYYFIKTGMEGGSPFLRIPGAIKRHVNLMHLKQLHNYCRIQHIHYSL